jgi:hypothetical protein
MRSRKEGLHTVLKRSLERLANLDTEPGAYEKEVAAFIQEYETLGEQPLLLFNANGCLCSYPQLSLPVEMIRTALTHYRELFNNASPAKVTLSEEYQEVTQGATTFVFQEEVVPIGYSTSYPPQTLMCWSPTRQTQG